MKSVLFYISLSLCLLVTTPAFAEPSEISPKQATNIVQKNFPGRILSVKQNAGQYRVKVLDEAGNLKIIKLDAKSGKIIREP